MKRNTRIAWIALLVLCAFVIGCLPHNSETLLSIYKASEALGEKDYDKLIAYVDIEALLSQSIDLTVDDMKGKEGLLGSFIGGVALVAKPQLMSESMKQIKAMVKDGSLEKYALKKNLLPGSVLAAKLMILFLQSKSQDRFKVIAAKKTETGEELSIEVRLKPDGPWLPVELVSKRLEKHSRINEIKNFKEIKGPLLQASLEMFLNRK